jgi:hypothetical protein
MLNYIYNMFTDKVVRNCHFPSPGRKCYNMDEPILLLLRSDTRLVSGNLAAHGGESCSSSREPGSDNCVQLNRERAVVP